MNKDNITKTTIIPVTIKLLEIGGKKLTQSIFNQIPNLSFLDLSKEERKSNFIGWVSSKDCKVLLFTFEGNIYKQYYHYRRHGGTTYFYSECDFYEWEDKQETELYYDYIQPQQQIYI